jgi:hypothetical protein
MLMSHARTRIVVGILATLVMLVAGGGSASATFMNMEPSGAMTLNSSGNISFTTGFFTVECEAALGGSMRAGPISISGAAAGEITSARMGGCRGGTIREGLFRERTPWTIKAESVLGTAPEAATGLMVTIENFAFSGTIAELTCLYSGTVRVLFPLTENNYYDIGTGRIVETRLRKVSGSALCPETGTLSGSLGFGTAHRVYMSALAEIVNDFTKGRFTPVPPILEWGLVAVAAEIARGFEFESRTAWRVTQTRVFDTTHFTVTGLNVGEILAAANYPMIATLRTRAAPRRPYISDYILKLEDRGGNTYTYLLIMSGRT